MRPYTAPNAASLVRCSLRKLRNESPSPLGGRRQIARLHSDSRTTSLWLGADLSSTPYRCASFWQTDDAGWEMPSALTPTHVGRAPRAADHRRAAHPAQRGRGGYPAHGAPADEVRWAEDTLAPYADDDGYGGGYDHGYDDDGYDDGGVYDHHHSRRGSLSLAQREELNEIARRDAADRRWAEQEREDRRARREAERRWADPPGLGSADSRERWREPSYGRHMEEGAVNRPGQPEVWVNPKVYGVRRRQGAGRRPVFPGFLLCNPCCALCCVCTPPSAFCVEIRSGTRDAGRIRSRAKEAVAVHYKRAKSAPRAMPSGRIQGQWCVQRLKKTSTHNISAAFPPESPPPVLLC